jgi:hypothetical protein
MRRLNSLLKGNADLQALVNQADRLGALQQLWNSVVPPLLRPHSRAGGLSHRRITVFADNGAVAAKLKLLAPGLLKAMQNKGLEVTSIRVEVQVKSERRSPQQAPRHLSRKAADSLQALAEALPESPLRTALQRLARHD